MQSAPPNYEPTDLLAYLFTSVGFKPDSSRAGPCEPAETTTAPWPAETTTAPWPAETATRKKKTVTFDDSTYALNTSPICVFYRRNAGIVICRVNTADPECEVVKRNGKILARVRRNPVAESHLREKNF